MMTLQPAAAADDSLIIYFGDDRTDEDAFVALKDRGVTVRVGGGRTTAALYFVRDTREVRRFLIDAASAGGGCR